MKMMVVRTALVATCLFLNSIICLSVDNKDSPREFSSLLKTVVNNGLTQATTRIVGPNGLYLYVANPYQLLIRNNSNPGEWENFIYNDDGTLVGRRKCLIALGFTPGSIVKPVDCDTAPANAKYWDFISNRRQISLRGTQLVLTAMTGRPWSQVTLEVNVFSSYQTWRIDNKPQVTMANIIGMNHFCLHSSTVDVWLSRCGSTGAEEKWLIYPDGTIRPDQRSDVCLSFVNLIDKTVTLTTCGLSATNERWILQENGHILNQNTNLVLDVAGGNPDLRQIIVYPPSQSTSPNQQWSILPV